MSTPTTSNSSEPTGSARLPPILRPINYDLVYHRIDLVHHRFEGSVALQCTALQSLKRTAIKLHAVQLNFVKAALQPLDDESNTAVDVFQAEEFRYRLRDQTCEIAFEQDNVLKENQNYILTVDFCGVLNDQMRGLYRSTYHALDGSVRTMATTQFEPTDARRAFPCLDEPALKATFCLTVHNIPAHLQCISNTPMAATHSHFENGKTLKTVVFERTPKMSTYLLALVVGEFDGISCTSRQIVTTVYTVPGKAAQGQFCLDVAGRCLDYYQDIFQIPYPLAKSDLLAIPDFAAGAMENWGCVTYREAKILVKPNSTSESMKRGIARTVCHELAHQWFGNLVTMDYWTQVCIEKEELEGLFGRSHGM